MTANVTIFLNEAHDAISAPEAALRFKPASFTTDHKSSPVTSARKASSSKGDPVVWKLRDDGQMTCVKVRLGIQGTEKVQVFSEELKPGDRVIVQAISKKGQEKHLKGLRF